MDLGIDVRERRICHAGFLTLVRYRLRHGLFGGGWSEVITRERIEHLNAAAVLLYDPCRDQVVMVLDAKQALADVRAGRLETMTAIIALQWLALNRQRLRLAWCPEAVLGDFSGSDL